MRNFRNRENQLIWESFMSKRQSPYSDEMESEPSFDLEEWDTDEENTEPSGGMAVLELDTGSNLETSEGCNEVIYSDVKKLAEYSKRILDICKDKELEPWMQAKLVKASDYVSDIWHRLDAEADFANTGFEQSDNISL